MKHSFITRLLLSFVSVIFLSSSGFAGAINLKANTVTPKIGEKIHVQVEVPSDYRGAVDYWVEFYDGNTWRNITKSNLVGTSDFHEGSNFFMGDQGMKAYDNFIAFPNEFKYRLYARDKYRNESYLEFFVSSGIINVPIGEEKTLSISASELQATLDGKKSDLLSSLNTTLQRIQNVYNERVKPVVETTMFKAVECLGFLSAGALDVNVANIKKEYETSILEQYVLISSDIKRFSVGLVTDDKTIMESISSFDKDYIQKISSIEEKYWSTFEKLKSDFEIYYTQNKDLVYNLAEKIQKIDTIQENYFAMESAYTKLYDALDQKTSVRSSIELSKKSASSLLRGDIDDMIRSYQPLHPEISYEKMMDKRDDLVKEFSDDADIFVNEIFKSDFDYAVYLKTLVKIQDFLSQYVSETSYKCSFIISSPVNWERVYLELVNDLEMITAGMQKAYTRVQSWDSDQMKTIDTTMISLFKDFYIRNLRAKQSTFRLYVTQLIRDTYNETHGKVETLPTPEISWTPYTFVKTYNRGVYALELTYLQQFLKSQGLYDGEFHGKYDAKTIEAVYKFQLQEGIITGKETNKSAYGWMGPATRAKLNQKMNP